MSGGGFALALTVFLACAVEAVEALTIVLAAATTRGWRSAMQGLAAALVVLAVVVAVLGPAVRVIPLTSLRLVVGALLLVFGLQWLRKAVLRGSGYRALHDETASFQRQIDAAAKASSGGRGIVDDWYGFTLSFKGVFLEGLEVVFIVVTFGANQHDIPLAVLGAAAAVAAVALLGVAMRAPLARVPENTMKFTVGVMLTAFGIFWSGEGAGVVWPHTDAALLALVPTIAAAAIAATLVLKRIRARSPRQAEAAS
ncbi:COG4280 domain-containing protein [Nocardia sp. NPDC059240]|uniref:COG4280 domain-containing protein n=1 Tax=Nocardia sp. NPDC059240 TaxID=3346786 RepID=UPI00369FE595